MSQPSDAPPPQLPHVPADGSELDNPPDPVGALNHRLDHIMQALQRERYLPRTKRQRDHQSRRFGELRSEATAAIRDATNLLKEIRPAASLLGRWLARFLRQWKYTGPSRDNLRILLVNAALLEFEIHLLTIRTNAQRTWYDQSREAPNRRQEVRRYFVRFRGHLRRAPINLAPVNFHTIASAYRAWSDEMSVPATEISGWLEAAIPVSRDLRYIANSYHTRWLWASLAGNEANLEPIRYLYFLARAIFDTAFKVLSGYGLRGLRFVISVILVVLGFAAAYGVGDALLGCRGVRLDATQILIYIMNSVSYLVGLGMSSMSAQAGLTCPNTALYAEEAASVVETGAGYVLLGIFVSLLWSAIQRRSIDTSRIALPNSPPEGHQEGEV